MAGLPASQRRAIELAYFGGKSSLDIAEHEGIPVGTAKSRIRLGLVNIRAAMESRDDRETDPGTKRSA